MATNVIMPQLGESVTEGTVTRWLKNVGDTIKVDEAIVEVSTDKVDTEIPSPVAGVLLEIKASQDAVIPVGGVMAIIGELGSAPVSAPVQEVQTPTLSTQPESVVQTSIPAVQTVPPVSSGATVNVLLPQLGESVTEGTITRWLKNVGDSVSVDEAIVEISTDKVDTEIPSPSAGVITEIKVAQDEVAPVGMILAVISTTVGVSGAQVPTQNPAPVSSSTAPSPKVVIISPPVEQTPVTVSVFAAAQSNGSDTLTTPIVRKLAQERGIDISKVNGSGPNGRIRKDDVLNAANQKNSTTVTQPGAQVLSIPEESKQVANSIALQTGEANLRGKVVQTSRLRRIIAERMVESLHVSAQLTSVIEVDVTRIANLRNKVKDSFLAREGVKLSFLPFFAKVSIETLNEFPVVNATITSDATQVTYSESVHLAVAVDTPKGLLVPVIKNAGDLTIAGLARKIQDVASRTRDNKVTPDELSGGTFTLTNTGSRGSLFDTPIINQPQVAILGTGAVVKRPIVVSGEDGSDQIAVRQMVYLALTYDHRIVDGADAARFLSSMKLRLEDANFESELGL